MLSRTTNELTGTLDGVIGTSEYSSCARDPLASISATDSRDDDGLSIGDAHGPCRGRALGIANLVAWA